MKKIYLDYAATTPVDPRVLRAMRPYFSDVFGNPSSLHSFGQQALTALDTSREAIAKAIGVDFREVIFTGSATEANNLALRGVVRESIRYQVSSIKEDKKPRIIISAIEHESVRETARDLEREGVEIVEIPVDWQGFVDLKKLEAALNEQTVLVSIIYANNEIGTVQPISKIAKILSNFKKGISNSQFSISKKKLIGNPQFLNPSGHTLYPIFHTDAAQAFQFLPCNPSELGVDLMTISAHKIYGPKGVGALYVSDKRQETRNKGQETSNKGQATSGENFLSLVTGRLSPIITGGGQEFGLRSGTENVSFIVGFSKAVQIAASARDRECARILKIRDYFWRKLKEIVPQAELNGSIKGQGSSIKEEGKGTSFLPNILNVYFPEMSAEYLITKLDFLGVAVSSGSACHTRAAQPSHVLTALGFSKEKAGQCVRFSFGRPTKKIHIDAALKKIKTALL
ncbi:MAG: hypothetical protein A3B25_00855 [Candidatus Ryanbacteria bacterium RIFCSPLOWO2_01_FULL_48_26]|uniref:cysteine desulfurase n=1 Tax=Candidatus Ryanbacteria bacterium RIFCSPLOWO2_01_FULL_48_26 TaxID=1802126 RepID=A0A1G2GRH2_9BACT|nr:MAG: hypothetical protein A3B25_00855 [Candidatus Ryanbacteria bacterium RIFCSPLOWO2_01_FULL_48_26]